MYHWVTHVTQAHWAGFDLDMGETEIYKMYKTHKAYVLVEEADNW